MVELALALGKYLFLGLLAVFLWQLYRQMGRDLERAVRRSEAPVRREPRLVAVSGRGMAEPGRTYPLDGELTIGRLPDNTIVIDDGFCSSHHARIWSDGQRGLIEDLGSRNGTVVDGRPIEPHRPTPLGEQAQIVLGETELRFER